MRIDRGLVTRLCDVLLALLSLSACNTIRGMGKDIEAAGKTIQKGSDDQQRR